MSYCFDKYKQPISDDQLVSPDGCLIIGTNDIISGTANATFTVNSKGSIDIEYSGETTVHWDSQETAVDNEGNEYVVDENQSIWPMNSCMAYRDYVSRQNDKTIQ
jgi:hypothetical protein